MFLIVGLGNPGGKYENTRHNVGFQAVDAIASDQGLTFLASKWLAGIVKASLWGHQVLLAKPETYMNESGRAVGGIASYFRIVPENIIIIHDDLDLDPARIKVVFNRGTGGHNGISSIVNHLGTKEFVRVRIGIGRPDPKFEVKNFVLSKFNDHEKELVDDKMPEIVQNIRLILDKGSLSAMSLINAEKV